MSEGITKQDLEDFRNQILNEIRELVTSLTESKVEKKSLRSRDVRKIFGISPGTLQNFRINGVLPYRKVGGIFYYLKEDIEEILGI